MKQGTRTRRRNIKGRKDPRFAEMVMVCYTDALVTIDEYLEKAGTREFDEKTGREKVRYDQLPDGCTVVEGLAGAVIFKDERVFRHVDRVLVALSEFGDEFCEADGASLQDLRYDRKGRVWGNELHITGLAYLAIAAGIAEWTQPRSEWKSNSDGYPKLRFKVNNLGEFENEYEHEQKNTDPSANSGAYEKLKEFAARLNRRNDRGDDRLRSTDQGAIITDAESI